MVMTRIVILCYYMFSIKEAGTMNISLTSQLEELVKKKVDSGRYGSASEVIREALRLLEEHDRIQAMRLEELRKEIKRGIDSGEPTPLDVEAIKARGRKRLAVQQGKAKS
jgi:antitoxin ParD1/3/4